jgi:hypothetical protein
MSSRHPSASKHVMSLEKVCEGRLCLQKERSKLMDKVKWLKETRLRVGIVSNSSFLNGDIGITGVVILNFDKQIIMSFLIYFLLYLLVLLYFRVISCDVIHCLVNIVYIYLCLSLEVHYIYSVN